MKINYKINFKIISITLATISMVLGLLCTFLPIFSFWNYRLCMIPYAIITVLLFCTSVKTATRTVNIIFGCIIIALSVIGILLGSDITGIIICSVLSVYTVILLMSPKAKREILGVTVIFAFVAIIVQVSTIYKWFDNYDLIMSGAYPEIPLEIADNMLITGFNEVGIAIIICCLLCSIFSVHCNISSDKIAGITEEQTTFENTHKSYDVCIFDTSTQTLRKEKREIDTVKFPSSKFSDNSTYYAIETMRDEKKIRIYYTKDNWNKQLEISINKENK